jgi:hypothetical protein
MHRFVNRPRIILYILFLLLLTTSCAQKPDETFTAYQEARNGDDVTKELSFYTEDVKYEVVDQWKIEGKGELRKAIETEIVLNSRLIFTDVKFSKNKVTCKVEEQNDWLKLAGIDSLHYEFREFIYEKGLIKEIRTKTTQESAEAIVSSIGAFGRWAIENRREEYDELRGTGLITKDNVGKWLALMREWREESEKEKDEEGEEKEQ